MLAINNELLQFSYHSLIPAGAGTPRHETWRLPPLPLLDSSSRGNEAFGIGYDVSLPSSYLSLIPAGAGTPGYENRGRRLAGLLFGAVGSVLVAGQPGAGDKPLASRSLRPRDIPLPHRSGFRPAPE